MERIAILGYGRFGRALTGLLQEAGHALRVFDPAAAAPEPLAVGSLREALDGAAWVVLAMPVPFMRAALAELRPLLAAEQTVIDVGSVKEEPCAWLDEILGSAIAHAGTHPLFGPLSLARGERPLRVVLCRSQRHPGAARRTRRLFEGLGCEVVERDPAAHDRVMAQTHAMAFFIAKALVEMGVGEDLTLAPPSFLGLAHMLAAVREDAGHLFAAIQRQNPHAAAARAELIEHLQAIHERLQTPTGRELEIPELPENPAP